MYYEQEERIYGHDEWIHESDVPNIEDTQDYITGLIEAIYVSGNIAKLEHCIEELAHIYDVKYEYREPQIDTKKHPLMQWFVETQNLNRRI